MTDIPENVASGHGLQGWWKLLTWGLGAGAVLFGLFSGFLKIDSRLEEHGKTLQTLAEAVKTLADKSATLEAVDTKIEQACLRMALANSGRGWVCPFASAELPALPPRRPALPKPKAASWPLFAPSKQ